MKTKCWEQSLIGFFTGSILMFIFMLLLIPKEATIDPGDLTVRDTSLIFGIMALVPLLGLALLATAYRYRKDKRKMWLVLIPALILIFFCLINFFGGIVTEISF